MSLAAVSLSPVQVFGTLKVLPYMLLVNSPIVRSMMAVMCPERIRSSS